MRPQSIVVAPPTFDHDLRLLERIEDLAIKQLVSKPGVEALDEPVLPRASWSDVRRLRPNRRNPFLDGLGDELRAVVGTNMPGYAAQDEQVRKHIDHIDGFQLSVHSDRQALMCELVDQVQHAVLSPVMGAILHKIVAPDVVRPFCSQPDAGPVTKPEPTFLRLLTRHFQPLPSPDPLDPLVVDDPAGGGTQKLCDLPVAVAAVTAGEINDVGGEPCLIVSSLRNTSLRRTMLSEHTADPALGQLQGRSDMLDAGPATGGAQKFC